MRMGIENFILCLPAIALLQVIIHFFICKLTLLRHAAILLFGVFVIVILSATGITPLNGFHTNPTLNSANLVPFAGIKAYLNDYHSFAVLNIWGNIFLFLPYGFFLPLIWRKNSALKTALHGLLFSLLIETWQLFLSRNTDIDDIILNTTGALLGYAAFKLFYLLLPRFCDMLAIRRGGFFMPWAIIAVCAACIIAAGFYELS